MPGCGGSPDSPGPELAASHCKIRHSQLRKNLAEFSLPGRWAGATQLLFAAQAQPLHKTAANARGGPWWLLILNKRLGKKEEKSKSSFSSSMTNCDPHPFRNSFQSIPSLVRQNQSHLWICKPAVRTGGPSEHHLPLYIGCSTPLKTITINPTFPSHLPKA